MAELAALSVTANVAQFVAYGLQGARFLYHAYRQTDDFRNERSEWQALTRSIRASVAKLEGASGIDRTQDGEFLDILDKARPIAQSLMDNLDRLEKYLEKGSRLDRMRFAGQSLWNRSQIDQLLQRLTRLRGEVSNRLIEISSLKLMAATAVTSELKSIAEANDAEVSKRVRQLRDELVAIRKQMQDAHAHGAHEQDLARLFEKMARTSSQTAEHLQLRNRVESILRSLVFETISERESRILDAHEHTFEWSLDETRSALPRWLRSGSGIYWITGKAGSGKSTLMKYLQEDHRVETMLRAWADERPCAMVSHYFWAPGTDIQRSLEGLFRTLLLKILLKDPELVQHICPGRLRDEHAHLLPWTLPDLEGCFQRLAAMERLPSKLCLFIDGLDEFEGDPERLIAIIRSMADCDSLKLCVASRPWLPFQNALGQDAQHLSVHDFTGDDIRRYTEDNLDESYEFRQLRGELPGQALALVNEIQGAAEGVFLWVYLVVRELRRGLSNHDDLKTLQRRLETMPRDLNRYFERMLASVDDVYWAEVSSLLGILASTRTPLNTLLTEKHRMAQRVTFVSSQDLVQFPPHGLDPALPNLETWSGGRRNLHSAAREAHDAHAERHLIVARCRDLIHVSQETKSWRGRRVCQVGFLHRTVADFIGPILGKRAEINAVSPVLQALSPLVALAEAYLHLIHETWSDESFDKGTEGKDEAQDEDEDEEREVEDRQNLLYVLSLALQVKKHSPAAYLHTMSLLCHVLPPSPSANVLVLVHGAVVASGVMMTDCHCSSKQEVGSLFWALHCQYCLAARNTFFTSIDKSMTQIRLHLCFLRPHAPTMDGFGAMTVSEQPNSSLQVVEALLRTYGADRSGTSTFATEWCQLVRFLQALHPDHLDEPDWVDNSLDVCLLLIRRGAVRYPAEGLDAVQALRRMSPIRKADPDGQILTWAFSAMTHKTALAQHESATGQTWPSWFRGLMPRWG